MATLVPSAAHASPSLKPGYGAFGSFCKSISSGAYTLGASFDNVFACGPNKGYGDAFDPYPNAFQCVELANRFEWAVYGKAVTYANGGSFVQTLAQQQHVPVEGSSNGNLPVAGDVISMRGGTGDKYGHVAVVTAVSVNGGNGGVTIMEQNGHPNGTGVIPVTNRQLGTYSGFTNFEWTMQGPHQDETVLLQHHSAGGYTVSADGALHPFGGAPALATPATWPGADIVRGAVLRSDDLGGYVLDLYGGVHPFGNAPAVSATAYWSGWDIARGIVLRSDNVSGYVLDGYGGLHPFGGAPAVNPTGYWSGWDIARGIASYDDNGGYVLDGYGGLHPYGDAPAVSGSAYWSGWDIATAIVTTHNGIGAGGYVLDGYGGMHPFGDAPAVTVSGYHGGVDSAVGVGMTPDARRGFEVDTNGVLGAITG